MMEACERFWSRLFEIFRGIVEDHWHGRCVMRDREVGQSRLAV
jgi:hypothetical protein